MDKTVSHRGTGLARRIAKVMGLYCQICGDLSIGCFDYCFAKVKPANAALQTVALIS